MFIITSFISQHPSSLGLRSFHIQGYSWIYKSRDMSRNHSGILTATTATKSAGKKVYISCKKIAVNCKY